MIATLPPSDYAILYRFSVCLVGLNEEAEQMVHEVIEGKTGRLGSENTPEISQRNCVDLLRAIWENKPAQKKDEPASNLPPVFQWMPLEERATGTLRSFGRFSDEEITRICGVQPTAGAPSVPTEKIAAALAAVPVTAELLRRFAVTVTTAPPAFRVLSPLGFALIFAGIGLIFVGSRVWRDWSHRANERIAQKFITLAQNTPESSLEPVDLSLAELSEVLFLKHGLENYPLPPDLLKMKVARLGITLIEGHKIVQIVLKNSHAMLMLFRSEDFGLDPEDPVWRMAAADGWVVALRTPRGQGNALAHFGSDEELQSFIDDAGGKPQH